MIVLTSKVINYWISFYKVFCTMYMVHEIEVVSDQYSDCFHRLSVSSVHF